MGIDTSHSSPNWSPRSGRPISMLVLHGSAGTVRSALRWLVTPLSQTSAHYVIDKSGHIYQLVPEEQAAWHAGPGEWHSIANIDDGSIGIELENANTGSDPYPEAQLAALLALSRQIVEYYGIAPENVVRHADIAKPSGSEIDPAGFPWEHFMAELFPGQRLPVPSTPPLALVTPSSLEEALRIAAYRQAGLTYRPGWAVFRMAAQIGLGSPVMEGFQLTIAGRAYLLQPFARDVLLSPMGEWQTASRLNQLRDEQAQGLRQAVLQALYQQSGGDYYPDWAFHQYAEREPLGPPLCAPFRLRSAATDYLAEIYALDTIYSLADGWHEVRRLSSLTWGMFDRKGPQLDEQEQILRDELLTLIYRRAGSIPHLEWPLHQQAIHDNLGAPLARPTRCCFGNRDYVAQPYALGILYAPMGDWDQVYSLK